MMFEYKFKFVNYKLRDYERKLALLELKNIIGNDNYKENNEEIKVLSKNKYPTNDLESLTFFSEILIRNRSNSINIVPVQVKYESTSKILKSKNHNEKELYEILIKNNSSRQYRYLTHLMHEYKGRYNPQLCKALINIGKIRKGELVLDPFVGSGTTLVECFLNGFSAIGVDLNPLSYLITKTKIQSYYIDIRSLNEKIKAIMERLKQFVNKLEIINLDELLNNENIKSLNLDIKYLNRWFPIDNLKKILILMREIQEIKDERIYNFFLLALSDILRKISFQDPQQLRIKRRKDIEIERNVFDIYLQRLNFYFKILKTYKIIKFSEKNFNVNNLLGDVRYLRSKMKINNNSVDLIVTSPPYATALPYIDTDRLSLFLLGYIDKQAYKELEKKMIGNREITKKERKVLENEFFCNFDNSSLPTQIKELIKNIYELNINSEVGFRRKNTASLLYKYFSDMQLAMLEMYHVLKSGKYCFMVVGCNNTVAGNTRIFIPTDDYIGLIGESIGFTLDKKIPITIPSSFMIHKKNSIIRESILTFKKY